MRILLDTALIRDPRAVALLARGALELMVQANEIMMRDEPRAYPPLLHSHIAFAPEPWAGKLEEFAPAVLVVARGWGDCDDLVAYRCAELRVFGDRLACTKPEHATIHIFGRENLPPPQRTVMHAQVRRANGTIEDVSRLLPRCRNPVAV